MAERVTLRAFREDDLPVLDRLCTDREALGTYEWLGFQDPRLRRRRWEEDGYVGRESTALAPVLDDDSVIGLVSWRAVDRSGWPGVVLEIGVGLLPEYRGRGLGIATHRVLVDHLFGYTTVHRLEAWVEAGNVAEEKTLARLGFRREGRLREVVFRDGAYRDGVVYGRLRTDPAPGVTAG